MSRIARALLLTVAASLSASVAQAGPAKSHSVALGAWRKVPYAAQSAAQDDTPVGELRVRPLVVDGKVKEWTTGDSHDVTDRSFTIRRALRLNDALPGDHGEHWIWQRGPWLLIDRSTGHVTALHLPDFDPAVSEVVWFRDLAAYCGVNASGKELFAVVAQLTVRKPMLARKLAPWDPADHPDPACSPATWQRQPLRISFEPTKGSVVSFDLVGASAVLVEDSDESDSSN